MSHSIWQLSGMHWVRWLLLWSCFFLLLFGFAQNAPAGAGTAGPAKVELQGPKYPSPEPERAAGKLTVDTVAVFDFNSMQTGVYGDNEPAAPGR